MRESVAVITKINRFKSQLETLINANKLGFIPYTKAEVDSKISNIPAGGTFSGTMDDITDGTTYKKVSTTEKSTWNNKLSSISKSNVEAVLTGEISTHTHAGGGLTQAQALTMSLI